MKSQEITPAQAAAALGKISTEKKAAAARRNGALAPPGPGLAPVPLADIECRVKAGKSAGSPCPGGDSLTAHHWSCPRGQAIKRRQKEGRDPLTGLKLSEASE